MASTWPSLGWKPIPNFRAAKIVKRMQKPGHRAGLFRYLRMAIPVRNLNT